MAPSVLNESVINDAVFNEASRVLEILPASGIIENFYLIMKALGVVAGVYLIYLIVMVILGVRRNRRLARIEEKLDFLLGKRAKSFDKKFQKGKGKKFKKK